MILQMQGRTVSLRNRTDDVTGPLVVAAEIEQYNTLIQYYTQILVLLHMVKNIYTWVISPCPIVVAVKNLKTSNSRK